MLKRRCLLPYHADLFLKMWPKSESRMTNKFAMLVGLLLLAAELPLGLCANPLFLVP